MGTNEWQYLEQYQEGAKLDKAFKEMQKLTRDIQNEAKVAAEIHISSGPYIAINFDKKPLRGQDTLREWDAEVTYELNNTHSKKHFKFRYKGKWTQPLLKSEIVSLIKDTKTYRS